LDAGRQFHAVPVDQLSALHAVHVVGKSRIPVRFLRSYFWCLCGKKSFATPEGMPLAEGVTDAECPEVSGTVSVIARLDKKPRYR